MEQWSIIENETQHKAAKERFEEIYEVDKASRDFHGMRLLALLVNQYEKKQFGFLPVDPIEVIKLRMEDFGCKPSDLAAADGDKGTVFKVLNYKQPLSLNMIRLFGKMLRISAEALIKEYELKNA